MLKVGGKFEGVVIGAEAPRFKHRWFGVLEIMIDGSTYKFYMSGTIAQWFAEGDRVIVLVKKKSKGEIYEFNDYELWKIIEKNMRIKIWPVFNKELVVPRKDAVSGKVLYEYKLRVREAIYESDYEAIAELEQYHYASKKIVVAVWRCDECGTFIRSNAKPICPKCGTDEHVHIFEIRGSTPASRFMIMELLERQPYEPKIVGYVRVDPPVPLMHRRLPNGKIIRNIREKIFPKEWFYPAFWPELIYKSKLKKLRQKFSRSIARSKLWEEAKWKALRTTNTAAARIARVVIHPDYRSDGLGQTAVKLALEWIKERRVPEMKKEKHLVETIAMMARYNPFFEKVGFMYMWDTASGRPVLYCPLTSEAREYIEKFLNEDPIARKHKGRLCVSRYGKVDVLRGPILFKNVTKIYSNVVSLERTSPSVRKVLEAFGVKERLIQRLVLRRVNLTINPGEVVVVVGASGSGKTTLLRLIYGAITRINEDKFRPTLGEIKVPDNARVAILLPGEIEPKFGEESILEHMISKTNDDYLAVEVLNRAGLSDAVLFRARFAELSTGQKERARLASLLASKPNLLLIDEFAAHLDKLTAMRVAKKLVDLVRNAGITLIVVTHRVDVIRVLMPDKIIFVGYGTAWLATEEEKRLIIGGGS